MKLFVIRSSNPLDHEGSPDVVAIFETKELADDTLELLEKAEEADTKATWGERWRSFALDFEVEEWETADNPAVVLQNFRNPE